MTSKNQSDSNDTGGRAPKKELAKKAARKVVRKGLNLIITTLLSALNVKFVILADKAASDMQSCLVALHLVCDG